MYEYKVVEAPHTRGRGGILKRKATAEEILSDALNELALDNWEFQRAETGLDKHTNFLVFRRVVEKLSDRNQRRESSDAVALIEFSRGNDSQRKPVQPRRARDLIGTEDSLTKKLRAVPVPPISDSDEQSASANEAAAVEVSIEEELENYANEKQGSAKKKRKGAADASKTARPN